jgi:hypothetical protein
VTIAERNKGSLGRRKRWQVLTSIVVETDPMDGFKLAASAQAEDKAKAGFILPLREVVAHFACWDSRPAETEVGGSDYGNAHLSTDISANLSIGFLPLLGKQAG